MVYLIRDITKLNIVLVAVLAMSARSLAGAYLGIVAASTYGAGAVKLALGVLILAVAAIIMLSKTKAGYPIATDKIAKALVLYGAYPEESAGVEVKYGATRTPLALLAFAAVGFISGFFGVGSGWALVPTYNLLMELPIKVAVASSEATIALGDVAGALAYLESGNRSK
ncbi:sulfite exporter TauE/SafE family protein [Pyrobaculum arsenaticum]|uniref:Probable membrane transporter protein n=1 Tax=Pyrobaculum arsenaticum TaxID=121277 RepID=A0A7L4PH36_9CREN|nr:sulfite exporter TauE/SafE family protein [Pyrobaculum arsenaticum]